VPDNRYGAKPYIAYIMEAMIDRKPSDRQIGIAAIVPWVHALLSRTNKDVRWHRLDAREEELRFRRACTVFETTLAAGLVVLLALAIATAFLR
jgi:hypothetical protein